MKYLYTIVYKLYEFSPVLFWIVWFLIYGSLALLSLVLTFAAGKWLYELMF